MSAPPIVEQLVNSFNDQLAEFKNRNYDEYTTRDRFINPLFVALGWDVHNNGNLPEHEREVYFEDRIRREDVRDDAVSTIIGKKPDYSFRINKRRMFYVEAKKPAEDLARNKAHAYQVRAYGWNANLPVSVLTDFEEFFVYDCRIPPAVGDDPRTGLVPAMSFTYDQYLTQWDRIASLLSHDSVLSGSLDAFREAVKPTRGAQTVDAAFLRDISLWREALARDINRRNPHLSQDDLNYAVQMTINRIIFLRICEDRGIERPETLKGALARSRVGGIGEAAQVLKGTVYPALVRMFRQADQVYNSGLFHFNKNDVLAEHPDSFTPNLDVGDEVLTEIINHLYYPYPYKFDVIPVEILGQVYEQFLGKVIVKQPGGDVDVEDKPEVRKAGGVYYTPTYIVDYIVEHTVGKLVEGKTPEQVSELRVLDPACGSGSFLVGAYQYLLDWHLRHYTRDPKLAERLAKGKNKRLDKLPSHAGDMQQGTPGYRLTITERKRILRNNIYGVDIDPQAVEVTKLSLLLKVVEGEQERQEQLRLDLEARERVLPDLGHNIKSGNSLIGPDFNIGTMFDDAETRRVNAFDWHREFPGIMQRGGFDAVVGNPPYGADLRDTNRDYFRARYQTYVWRGESYLLFIEKALQLLRHHGHLGYIVPDTYLNLGFTRALRSLLLKQSRLHEVVLLPSTVFSGATVDTTLLLVERVPEVATFIDSSINVKVFSKKARLDKISTPQREFRVAAQSWYEQDAFNLQSNENEADLLQRLDQYATKVADLADMFYGIKAYQVGKGKPPQTPEIRDSKPFTSELQPDATFLPFFDGKHIGRYELLWNQNNWLKYGPWLAEPRSPEKYEGEKLLIRKIVGKTLIATYFPETSYCNTLLFVLKLRHGVDISLLYLLGLLNSHLIGWYFRKKFQISESDTFPQIMIRDILQFPIPTPTPSRHHTMVQLVDRMLALHKALASTNNPATKERLQRDIATTDRAIDDLVYDLYALTEDERKIVEGTP